MLALLPMLIAGLLEQSTREWSAPPDCPDGEAVLAGAAALGANVEEATFGFEGRIEQVEDGHRLDFQVWTSSGTTTRTLHAPSCAELAAAASLVLSVAIDPLGHPQGDVAPPPGPQDPPDPEPPPAKSPAPAEPRPVATAAPTSSGASDSRSIPAMGSIVFAGTLGRGLSPGLDGRAQLGAALDVGYVRVEALGFHAFARPVVYEDDESVGAQIRAWGGSMRAGPQFSVGRLSFALPVGIEVAAVLGTGFGAPDVWTRRDIAWGVLVSPALRVSLARRISLGADAELGVAVRRPGFVVDSRAGLYRTPRVGVRGGIRLEIRFAGVEGDQITSSRGPR